MKKKLFKILLKPLFISKWYIYLYLTVKRAINSHFYMFTAYSNNYYNFKKSKALLVTFWSRLIGIPRECSDFEDSGW